MAVKAVLIPTLKSMIIHAARMHHRTVHYIISHPHLLISGTISLIRKCKEFQGYQGGQKISHLNIITLGPGCLCD